MLRGPQRLHLGALGVWALSGVGPIVLLIIAGTVAPYVAVFIVTSTLIASSVRWWRFTWYLDDEALVIEQGLLQRQRRVIPRERIQSVERVRNLRHRLFRVVELQVESVGGASTEGQLDALRPDIADLIRSELLGQAASATPSRAQRPTADALDEEPPLAHVGLGQLVLAGVTGGRVGIVAALLGFASQIFAEQVGEVFERVFGFLGAQGWVGALLAVGAFVLAAFALSVVATTLAYWDFTLTYGDRKLHTRRGLLQQRSGTIPLHRVQSLRVEENLLRRRIGRAAVKVEVAGRAGADASETSIVLPIGTRDEAFALVDRIAGRTDIAALPLAPAPRGALARRHFRAAVATILATGGLTVWQGPAGLAGVVLAVPFVLLARASYQALGRAAPTEAVVARSGVFVRTTHVTPERSLQAVALQSTPFQRRRDLATLVLHIARSPGGGDDPALIDLPQDEGWRELVRLAGVADLSARRPRSVDGRILRAETPHDEQAIARVHAGAFGRDDEGALVDSLRTQGHIEPGLSVVVEEDGDVVAHALLTPVALEGDCGAGVAADGTVLLLGPVAVLPDRQEQGIGGRLVKRCITIATATGAHRIVLLGAAGYYERFDFERAQPHGVTSPVDAPDETWLVRRLPADDGAARGRVVYPAPFAELHGGVVDSGRHGDRD